MSRIDNYPAVGNTCLLDMRWFDGFELCRLEAIRLLQEQMGVIPRSLDLLTIARFHCQQESRYQLRASRDLSPQVVDCSSFICYLYGLVGVCLPRASIDQSDMGMRVDYGDLVVGDLVFSTGPQNYYKSDPTHGIGHVGLATGTGTVIHASASTPAIQEVPLEDFFREGRAERGAVRILPPSEHCLTVITPEKLDIRWSKTLLRFFQQRLPIIRRKRMTPVSS